MARFHHAIYAPKYRKMVHVNEVPDDILLCIFEACSRHSIVEVSKVNKRFHVLSLPQLYNTINWKWHNEKWNGETYEIFLIPPILLLLRTIFTTPHVSKHIQFLELEGNTFYSQGPFRKAKPPKIPLDSVSVVELDHIITIVEDIQSRLRMPLAQENLLVEEFRAGTMDAILPVLLSQLSNLKFLHLGPNFTKEIPLLAIVLKALLCAPENTKSQVQNERFALSSFESLQEVMFTPSIDHEGYSDSIPMDQRNIAWGNERRNIVYTAVLPFMYAPRIQKIRATIEEPCTTFKSVFKWLSREDQGSGVPNAGISPPIAITLKHLDITLLREASLGELLAQCPNLESLRWEFQTNPERTSPPPFLDCKELERSLEHVKDTLTSLVLKVRFVQTKQGLIPAHGIMSTLTNLESFPHLARLEIPWVLLLGLSPSQNKRLHGLLPRGLQKLIVTDDLFYDWTNTEPLADWDDVGDVSSLAVVEDWLKRWRESVPQFQKFVFLWRHADIFDLNDLREKCAEFEKRFGCRIVAVGSKHMVGSSSGEVGR